MLIGVKISAFLIFFCSSVTCAGDCGDYNNGDMYPIKENACLPTYYHCVNGIQYERQCAATLVFDYVNGNCNYPSEVESCSSAMINATGCISEDGNSLNGLSYTKPGDCAEGYYYTCTNGSSVQNQCTEGYIFDASIQKCVAASGDIDCESTSVPDDTYIGFVIDNTGSMAVEISTVKEWIEGCVMGTNATCGSSPSGGWVIVSYRDPDTSEVVGPTLQADDITNEIESYWAYGGGDCPEMAFTGVEKLASAVPPDNTGCKIYLITDATAKDIQMKDVVTELLNNKSCSLELVLTGCCGECPPPCEFVSPGYCQHHVIGPTRYSVSDYDEAAILFYKISEETGGNIYIIDKPGSMAEMLEFLKEEVTLGFHRAGDITRSRTRSAIPFS